MNLVAHTQEDRLNTRSEDLCGTSGPRSTNEVNVVVRVIVHVSAASPVEVAVSAANKVWALVWAYDELKALYNAESGHAPHHHERPSLPCLLDAFSAC